MKQNNERIHYGNAFSMTMGQNDEFVYCVASKTAVYSRQSSALIERFPSSILWANNCIVTSDCRYVGMGVEGTGIVSVYEVGVRHQLCFKAKLPSGFGVKLAFSDTGNILLAAAGGEISCFSVPDGKKLYTWNVIPGAFITSLSYYQNSMVCVVHPIYGKSDDQVHLYYIPDVNCKDKYSRLEIEDHNHEVWKAFFIERDRLLLGLHVDCSTLAYAFIQRERMLSPISRIEEWEPGEPGCTRMRLSCDRKYIVRSSSKIIDVRTDTLSTTVQVFQREPFLEVARSVHPGSFEASLSDSGRYLLVPGRKSSVVDIDEYVNCSGMEFYE